MCNVYIGVGNSFYAIQRLQYSCSFVMGSNYLFRLSSFFYMATYSSCEVLIKQSESEQQRNIMGANKSKNLIELPLIEKNIIIHKAFKMHLQLSEVDQFPHGLDGLKLWEAGIVLARYIILNVEKFNNKTVLELGSGVGIGGMTVDKWTNCSQVILTDYHPQVLAQIEKNCKKNKCEKSKVELLDWKQHQKLEQNKYDIIMGSDIVYFGCPVKQLYQVFKRCLKSDGIGIIIIPDRKNYAQLFLKQVQDSVFTVEKQKLERQSYFSSPLQDQQKGKQMYSLLYKIDFYAFVLKKKV